MFYKKIFVLIMLAILASCDNSKAPIAAAPSISAPSKFEVRDFNLDIQNSNETSTIKGRGTLLTKDDSLKNGTYMVWLSVKRVDRNNQERRYTILLRDGVGLIDIQEQLPPDETIEVVKYSDWQVLGFVKLQDGEIVSASSGESSK